MKAIFQKTTGLIGPLLFLFSCGGAGGETPATDIPAPVSHLSASSPGSDGLVRLTAEAGFTDGGTTVTITNTNAVSKSFWDFLIRPVYAHSTHAVTSNADGSFQETIEGAVGDVIGVAYIKDGAEESTSATVPADTPPLPLTADIQDVSIDPTRGKALIVANDGADGFVHVVDLSDKSYESTIDLPGASGASRIATDPTNGETIVLDTENVTAIHVTLAGGGSVVSTTGIIPSSDLAGGPSGDYVLIAHTDPTPALSFFDLTSDGPTATGDSETEEGTNQDSALLVAIDSSGGTDVAGVISLLPDSSWLLTTHNVDPIVPAISQTGAIVLDIGEPGGMAVFNSAAETYVTDSSADLVLRILLADGTTTAIDVGGDPRGVAVDETAALAYVVNNDDRTVSVVSLADDAVESTTEVGLAPTEIAVDPTGADSTVVVLNTGDETVTLID